MMSMIMEIVCILVLLVTTAVSEKPSSAFHGYKLISVIANSRKQIEVLQELERDYKDADFWAGPFQNRTSTLMLPPNLLTPIEHAMTKAGIAWEEREVNVAKIIQDGMKKTAVPPHQRHARSAEHPGYDQDIIDHHNYHSYDEILSYLDEFEKTYPNNVEVSFLKFPTHEGRKMAMIKLFGQNISSKKRSIVMESGIHAREWVSPATTLYTIEKILQKYRSGDSVAKSMLDWYDWYIVPVTNPDGYEYTRRGEGQRLWRKNRRLMRWYCQGVDLNRNFDVYFGTTGVSKYCESYIYPGNGPFSEPETVNIKELFAAVNDSVIAYLSLHSFSQFILVPWSFSNVGMMPDNNEQLVDLAKNMATAIKNTHGKIYQVGTAWDLLKYAASGSSQDWTAYVKPDIYALTLELRPENNDGRGFNLPPDEIIPTGQEFLASLESLTIGMKDRKATH